MNLLQEIMAFLKERGIDHNPLIIKDLLPAEHQEDAKDFEARKRVRKLFNEQESSIQSRTMKPHDFTCEDTFLCTNDECGKFVPDKIVSEPS